MQGKWKSGIILSLLLVISALVSPTISVFSDYPRHINPDDLQVDDVSGQDVISLYDILLSHLVDGNYALADQWLLWASQIYTPEELEALFNEYNSLISSEIIYLSQIERLREDFLSHLSHLNLSYAFSTLMDLGKYLEALDQTHIQLHGKTVQLADILNTSPEELLQLLTQIDVIIAEKYMEQEFFLQLYSSATELMGNFTGIDDLFALYPELVEKLGTLDLSQLLSGFDGLDDFITVYPGLTKILAEHPEMVIQAVESVLHQPLKNTHLTLIVNDTKPSLGTNVFLEGILLDSKLTGIPHQQISIYLNETLVLSSVSDVNGYYSQNLLIPFLYSQNLFLYSHYEPSFNLTSKYYPATSKQIQLTPYYLKPTITINAPAKVIPGEKFEVTGRITVEDNPVLTSITINSFHENLNMFSDLNGHFSAQLETPLNVTKRETITVKSESNELLGPAQVTHELQIMPQKILLINTGPDFAFGGKATLTGAVAMNDKKIQDCLIILKSSTETITTRTNNQGIYKIELSLPFRWFYDKVNFTVKAEPTQPILKPTQTSGKVRTYNLITLIGVPLTIVCLLWYAIVEKKWRIAQIQTSTRTFLRPKIELDSGPVDSEPKEITFEDGSYTRAPAFFNQILSNINILTKTHMSPSQTIREYLESVKTILNIRLFSTFERFSIAYEQWLYGPPGTMRSRARFLISRFYKNIKGILLED